MRTKPDCLTCILGDVFAAARQTAGDDAALRVGRAASEYLSEHFDYTLPPSYHITQVHRILKHLTGQQVPFAAARAGANEVGLRIASRVRTEVAAISDPAARLRHAALWALAANSLDSRTAGTGYAFDPASAYEYLFGYLQHDPAVDQLEELTTFLRDGPRVLFIHDNVGEIALDRVLIEELRRSGRYVTSALRGGPITSDATLADGIAVGLEQAADRVILAGPDTLGISIAEISDEMRQEMLAADLVIAKGQANYYVLSEYRDRIPGKVFALFTVKCQPVGDELGVARRSSVAYFLPGRPTAAR